VDPDYRALLNERFGTVRQLERERPPTPYEITKRRLVLLGRLENETRMK
jgi:hypothetical protein